MHLVKIVHKIQNGLLYKSIGKSGKVKKSTGKEEESTKKHQQNF